MSKKISFEQLRALQSAYIWAEFLKTYKKCLQGDALKAWQTTVSEAVKMAESAGVHRELLRDALEHVRENGGGFEGLRALLLEEGYTLK